MAVGSQAIRNSVVSAMSPLRHFGSDRLKLPIPSFFPSSQKQRVGTRKSVISTWEELLDLWREFGLAPI